MHPSVVNAPPSLPRPGQLLGQLVIDSHHETEVRSELSMETMRCLCRVRIYTRAEGVIALLTEQVSDRRITDTYAMEQMASELLPLITSLDRQDTITWIAHVPPNLINPHRAPSRLQSNHDFFHVTFDRLLVDEKYLSEKTCLGVFARSKWERVSLDHIESLTGVQVVER